MQDAASIPMHVVREDHLNVLHLRLREESQGPRNDHEMELLHIISYRIYFI